MRYGGHSTATSQGDLADRILAAMDAAQAEGGYGCHDQTGIHPFKIPIPQGQGLQMAGGGVFQQHIGIFR